MANDEPSTDLLQKNSTSSCQNVTNKNSFVPVRESRSFGGGKKSSPEMCLTVTELEKLTDIMETDNTTIRTREQSSMNIYTVGPEILSFQGQMHTKDEIAPIWKKDCRMWLWKSSSKRLQKDNKQAYQRTLLANY